MSIFDDADDPIKVEGFGLGAKAAAKNLVRIKQRTEIKTTIVEVLNILSIIDGENLWDENGEYVIFPNKALHIELGINPKDVLEDEEVEEKAVMNRQQVVEDCTVLMKEYYELGRLEQEDADIFLSKSFVESDLSIEH